MGIANHNESEYKLSHHLKDGVLHVNAHDKDGKQVAYGKFSTDHVTDRHLKANREVFNIKGVIPELVDVHKDHRNKGLATRIYNHAAAVLKQPIKEPPKEHQSELHQKFWKKYSGQVIKSELFKHDFGFRNGDKANPLHGIIDHTGQFHYMDPNEGHNDKANELGYAGFSHAIENGCITLGHGGNNNIGIHQNQLEDKLSPQVSTLRKLMKQHWNHYPHFFADVTGRRQDFHGDESDLKHFVKTGKLIDYKSGRPYGPDPMMKKESQVDLGTKIESEHRDTIKQIIADVKAGKVKPFKEYFKKISQDHLSEIKDYYDRLVSMENDAKKSESDLVKMSQPRLKVPNQKGVSSRADQQVYPMDMASGKTKSVNREYGFKDFQGNRPVMETEITYPQKKMLDENIADAADYRAGTGMFEYGEKKPFIANQRKDISPTIAAKVDTEPYEKKQDAGIFNPFTNFAMAGKGATEATTSHEGTHYLTQQLINKYGRSSVNHFYDQLLSKIPKDVHDFLHNALMGNKNYQRMNASTNPVHKLTFKEEKVNLLRDFISKGGRRNVFKQAFGVTPEGDTSGFSPEHYDKFRKLDQGMKKAWKDIIAHGKQHDFNQQVEERLAAAEDMIIDLKKEQEYKKYEAKRAGKPFELNPLHGFISPDGTYHHLQPKEKHWDKMTEHADLPYAGDEEEYDRYGYEELHDMGYVGVGHGGYNNISGGYHVLNNPLHPANKTLRNLIKQHWMEPNFGIGTDYENHQYDTEHFLKHGKLKDYDEDLLAASEKDLIKGSLQRKKPFDTQHEDAKYQTDTQRYWVDNESKDSKYNLGFHNRNAKTRALNKLSAQTHVRRHPETKERMFLMHRNMNDDEFFKNHIEGSHMEYEPETRNSWTPDFNVAQGFGRENTVSAWIPESALIHSVNQYNIPFSTKSSGKTVFNKYQNRTQKDEQEWIVNHTDKYPHANMASLEALTGTPRIHHKITNVANFQQKMKEITEKSKKNHEGNKYHDKLAASEKDVLCLGLSIDLIKKEHNKAFEDESEKIRENAKIWGNKKHDFKDAKWTHPNGHPRCLRCGQEEPTSGVCIPLRKSEVSSYNNWRPHTDEELENEYNWEYDAPHKVTGHYGDVFPTLDHFVKAARKGKIKDVTPELHNKIGFATHVNTVPQLKALTEDYQFPRDVDRIVRGFHDNSPIPMPIVLHDNGKNVRIMGGNTRMNAALIHGITPKALYVNIRDAK